MSYHKYPAIGIRAVLREPKGATRTAKVVSTDVKQMVVTVEDEQGDILNFRPYHWNGPGTQWTHVRRYPTRWLRDDSGIVVVEFEKAELKGEAT